MLCVRVDLKQQLHGKSNDQLTLPPVTHFQTEHQGMKTTSNQADQTLFANANTTRYIRLSNIKIYDTVVTAVCDKQGQLFMTDAPGGTGKKLTEKAIVAHLRAVGIVTVLIVASTGTAALKIPRRMDCPLYEPPPDDRVVSRCRIYHRLR